MSFQSILSGATNLVDTFVARAGDRGEPQLGQSGEGAESSVFDSIMDVASQGVAIWRTIDPAKQGDILIQEATRDQQTVNPSGSGSAPTATATGPAATKAAVPEWVWWLGGAAAVVGLLNANK